MRNFIKNNEVRPLELTTGTSDGINVGDYQAIVFLCQFAASDGDNGIIIQHSDEDDNYSTVEDGTIAVGHEDEAIVTEVYRPKEAWVRIDSVGAGENVDSGFYILVGPGEAPVTNDVAETIKSELLATPDDD